MRERAVGLALVAALAACAAGPSSAPAARLPDPRAAQALPEPDPSCRATVREALARNGLEQVIVKVALDGGRRLRLVEVLSPDLTAAGKLELRSAFAACPWAPVPSNGGAETWTAILVGERLGP
jgi:hypothetical protein